MAETAAVALIQVIFEKLADEAFKKYARSQNIHSELKQLGIMLSHVQALLNDASHKEITDESVRLWLNNLQHLAYDIDDVLDHVATEAMHRELTLQEPGASTSMVRKLIPTCCTKFSLSHRLSPKLDDIKTKLQQLEKQNPGLIVKGEKPKNTSRRDETSLLESDVVGRKGEREKLIKKLLQDEASKENFIIVPIVGMGGVGKTTLARILYNDPRVKGHFELTAWVCVSDDYDILKISKTILQDVSEELIKEYENLNQLQVALQEQFKDKRFLLVLDDVWTENYDDWENLMRPFHSGATGSRVIITTRHQHLLKRIGFSHLDHLESLACEDALSLLALHALGVDNFDSHATLKPQAECIVKKCGGLPLALKAIGRLLRTRTEGEEWDAVLNSQIWNLENADQIVPALRLSYHDLSADLKRLFAYCSLFPKDFLFDKEELVLLWMAEGYLNESPEHLGHEYFEKLLSRSFFQPAPNGEPFFVMHDLMNDLATFVAGEYFFRLDNQMEIAEEALAKYRHMSFIREEYVAFQKFRGYERARNLRTLLAVYVGNQGRMGFFLSNKILVDLLPKLPLLRVLSLSHFTINEVPDFIGTLKQLRYLNLSKTNIKELPENVGNLYHLQTLIVSGCRELTKMPESFLKLKRLRHFDISGTPLLKKLPLGIGELISLQTLNRIIIEGNNGFAIISELKGLKNLHGEISIEGLDKVQSSMHAREANLSLKRLTKLELEWGDGSQSGTLEKEVLNELKPHVDTLKKLVVKSYKGIEFPNWVGDPSFHRLVHVSLRRCRKCESLPSLGRLPSLKVLSIQGMNEIKVIGLECTSTTGVTFPSLEILRFEDMLSWEVWSTNSKVMFPCLRELQIRNCPNLSDVSLEAVPSLRVLTIHECCESVLRNLVRAASLTNKLEIRLILGLTDEVWRGVIENFGAVEEPSIEHCNEIRYMWESDVEASKVLVKLKELKIGFCEKLVSLGEKEDNIGSNLLSSLRKLEIYECKSMERLCCPNSIESLDIRRCDSVRQVFFPGGATTTTGEGGLNLKSLTIMGDMDMEKLNNTSMPMLQAIDIRGCKNLKIINQLSNSTHLTRLDVSYCESMESFPSLQLPNLTRLDIQLCKNLKEICDLQLPNLISCEISNCKNLESIPELVLCNLTLLRDLSIRTCPMIDGSFPRGIWPPNLVSLEIGGLKKPISEWGYQNFPASLVELKLWHEGDVRNLSELSHLFPSSLTSLDISRFNNLESVSKGLQHLTSLQHLQIYGCPEVKDLPETLLPTLLTLRIDECRKLKERCEGRGSHYWPLISHIPKIQIWC